MRLRIEVSSDAEWDLKQHARYIGQHDPETAIRFVRSARQTFKKLAEYKFLGSRYDAKMQELNGLREWSIENFPRHLVFFEVHSDHIAIARIVHSSQDWRKI